MTFTPILVDALASLTGVQVPPQFSNRRTQLSGSKSAMKGYHRFCRNVGSLQPRGEFGSAEHVKAGIEEDLLLLGVHVQFELLAVGDVTF